MRMFFRSMGKIAVLLASSIVLTACLGDDDRPVQLNNETAITKATLDVLHRTIHTRTRDGLRDSSYVVNITGSLYELTIDQAKGLIYNVDSLPYGTRVDRVVFKDLSHTGIAAIRSLHTGKDSVFVTKDSTDLSQARQLVIRSLDGQQKRNYTIELRVHQQEGDSAHWQTMTPEQWAAQNYAAPGGDTFKSNSLWWKVADGTLLSSTDGQNWTPQLIDPASATHLPTAPIVGASRVARTSSQWEDVLLYGTKEGKSCVWKGSIDHSGTYATEWMHLPTADNSQPAPTLTQAHLLAYDDGFLLLGIDAQGRLALRYSSDRGRTWMPHPSLHLPRISQQQVEQVEALVDATQHLWLRVNEQEVWRGHVNRHLWSQPQHVFLRSRAR